MHTCSTGGTTIYVKCSLTCIGTFRMRCHSYAVPWTFGHVRGSLKLTSFLISHSKFRMQSSFLLRQRWAAMRFLLRRLTSWMNSSCSEVSLCIFNNIWKSFRGRFVIWSTGKGSFTWRKTKKSKKSKINKAIRFMFSGQIYTTFLESVKWNFADPKFFFPENKIEPI